MTHMTPKPQFPYILAAGCEFQMEVEYRRHMRHPVIRNLFKPYAP